MTRSIRRICGISGVLGIACLSVHLLADTIPELDCTWDLQSNTSPQCSTSNNVYCTIRCTIPKCENTHSLIYTGAAIRLVSQVEPGHGDEWDGWLTVNCAFQNACRYGTNLGEKCKYSGSGIWVCDESEINIELCHRCYPVAPTITLHTYQGKLAVCDDGG